MKSRLPALLALVMLAWISLKASAAVIPGAAGDSARWASIEDQTWHDPWAAREILFELEQQGRQSLAGDPARFYMALGHALLYIDRDNEFAEAIARGKAAITPATDPHTVTMLSILEGIHQRREGRYEQAIDTFETAIAEANELGSPFLHVFALSELAFSNALVSRNEKSLARLQEAFDLALNHGDTFLVAQVNETFGAYYGYIEEDQQSISHYQRAVDSYRALGYPAYESEALYGIASTFRRSGQYEEALRYFAEYMALTQRESESHGRFLALYGIGMTHAAMGDCPQALQIIEEAVDEQGPPDYKAELYKSAARCHASADRVGAARSALATARELLALSPLIAGTHWDLETIALEADIEAAAENYQKAYRLMDEYQEKMLALQRREGTERLMNLRVAMENERKDAEIALLEEQARIDALELERNRQRSQIQRLAMLLLISFVLVVLAFVAIQRRNMRRFRELSTRDELTGVWNRRYIFQRLRELVEQTDPEHGQLSAILFDIDDFKPINDQHGHPTGDRVLKEFAAVSRRLMRPSDDFARLGGEEWMCLLPRTTVQQALEVAERLLTEIRRHEFTLPSGQALKITVSAGIARLDDRRTSAEAIYAAADEALYMAKKAGKDCVIAAG